MCFWACRCNNYIRSIWIGRNGNGTFRISVWKQMCLFSKVLLLRTHRWTFASPQPTRFYYSDGRKFRRKTTQLSNWLNEISSKGLRVRITQFTWPVPARTRRENLHGLTWLSLLSLAEVFEREFALEISWLTPPRLDRRRQKSSREQFNSD